MSPKFSGQGRCKPWERWLLFWLLGLVLFVPRMTSQSFGGSLAQMTVSAETRLGVATMPEVSINDVRVTENGSKEADQVVTWLPAQGLNADASSSSS